MSEENHIHKTISENADSITLGSASKEGLIKVYGNFNDMEAFQKKIDNALAVRTYFKNGSEEQ